ncbi:MAG: folylpolyglutamate synthase/dihydrofolate synthase family protein [Eubacteriales bacterium]
MTYKQAMEYVEEVSQYGSVLGLESMQRLLAYFHNPHKQLKCIHVAGTNGKGSTIAFLSAILMGAKYRVGRYVSPTISSYCERIQVNERTISQKKLAFYMEQVKEACEYLVESGYSHPTIFEIETVIGFLYYGEQKCDIILLETGLGGRLDATNVIESPLVSVITAISMDHMTFLGDTIEAIAREKAGIIKTGCPVVTWEQSPVIDRVIREIACQQKAPLYWCKKEEYTSYRQFKQKQVFTYGTYGKMEITLLGKHQVTNGILALKTVEVLGELGYQVTEDAIKQGLYKAKWFGRFTQIGKGPDVYIDGAHNVDAAMKLVDALEDYWKEKEILYIVGMLRDKECDKVLEITAPYASQIITITPPNQPRAMHAYELAQVAQCYHRSVTAADSILEAVEMSYLLAKKEHMILAFGSLTFLGAFSELIRNRRS